MIDIVIHAESSSEDCVSVDPTLAPIMEPDFGSLALDFEHGTSTVDSSAVHVTGLLDFWAPWQPQANPACSAIEPISWIESYVTGEWPSFSAERVPTSISAQVCLMEGWDRFDLLGCFAPSLVIEHDGPPHSVSSSVEEAADRDLDRLLGELPGWRTDDSYTTVGSPSEEQPQREAPSQEPGSAE